MGNWYIIMIWVCYVIRKNHMNINELEEELTPVARRAGCSSAATEAMSITVATEIRETFMID